MLSTSRSLSVHLIQCSWKESVGNRLHLKNFTVMSPSKTKAPALRTAQTPGCRELSLPNTFCPRQKNCETVQRPQYTSDKQKTKQTNMDFLQYALELGIYLQLYCSTSMFWSWAQSFSLSPKLNVFACRLCLIVILSTLKSLLLYPTRTIHLTAAKTIEKLKWVSTA